MKFLSIALFIPSLATAAFIPHKLDFDQLRKGGDDAKSILLEGLTDVGLMTVKNIPGFDELRRNTLVASSQCLLDSEAAGISTPSVELEDGTRRFTMGYKISSGETSELEGADLGVPSCKVFHEYQDKFRALVTDVTENLVGLMDDTLGLEGEGRRLMMDTETGKSINSIKQLVSEGIQLEHFHSYEKQSSAKDLYDPDFARKFHVDHGLFIVLAPAMSLEKDSNRDHGFFIKLRNGEIVQPDFSDNQAELVLMIGDGFSQWLNPKIEVDLRATPHAVMMPYTGKGYNRRAWYGRMVLPKESFFLDSQKMTFGELRNKLTLSNKEDLESNMYSACSSDMVINGRFLQDTCDPETELLCWLACRSPEEACAEDEDIVCARPTTDGSFVECLEGEHGGGCNAFCSSVLPTPEPTPEPVGDGESSSGSNLGTSFCNGIPSSMYMNGFTLVGDANEECIVFLFPGFELDSGVKYFIASVFTIAIGMFTELVVMIRRKVTKTWKSSVGTSISRIGLYGLQVAFGYIAMLIAMTYSVLLFFMIILGLTIGHTLFNFNVSQEDEDQGAPGCHANSSGRKEL